MPPLERTRFLEAGWALLPLCCDLSRPGGSREHWWFPGEPAALPHSTNTHLDGDEQRVQSSGLLRGGHGLAAGLQFADGNPAHALEGLVGLHLLQGDDEDVALFVFDGLEEDLPQVLDAQQPLCDRVGRQEKAEGQGTSRRHSGSGQLGCACSCLL